MPCGDPRPRLRPQDIDLAAAYRAWRTVFPDLAGDDDTVRDWTWGQVDLAQHGRNHDEIFVAIYQEHAETRGCSS